MNLRLAMSKLAAMTSVFPRMPRVIAPKALLVFIAGTGVACHSSTSPATSNTWHFVVAPLKAGTISPSAFNATFDPVTGMDSSLPPPFVWTGAGETFDSLSTLSIAHDTILGSAQVRGANPDSCASINVFATLNGAHDSATGVLVLNNRSGNPTLPCFEMTTLTAVKQ